LNSTYVLIHLINKKTGFQKGENMITLTTQERFKRLFEHKDVDRIGISDYPWNSTLERWYSEGLPANSDLADYFGMDNIVSVMPDYSPQYPQEIIEETDEYKIFKNNWGATVKDFKHKASVPDFIDFVVKDPDSWLRAKERMIPDIKRIPWEHLEKNYKTWLEKGSWKQINFWFGFDVTHSWFVGTERLLIAIMEEPEWVSDMFNHFLNMNIALAESMIEKGYKFDAIKWPDDMGYKHAQFFSVDTYREILKPLHKKAIDWAHSKGMKAHLHSCGDINPFIPELIDIELDALHPLEVKAGMDPEKIKKEYGNKICLNGGIDALLYESEGAFEEEVKRIIPILKQDGGYIFSSDHSIPSSVSLNRFKGIVDLVKQYGSF